MQSGRRRNITPTRSISVFLTWEPRHRRGRVQDLQDHNPRQGEM